MEIRKVIPGELYRHYKMRWYFVLGESTHTETREEYVVYFPLYLDTPRLFVRPKEMFLEKLEPGKCVEQDWRFLESDACELKPIEKKQLLTRADHLLNLLGLSIQSSRNSGPEILK